MPRWRGYSCHTATKFGKYVLRGVAGKGGMAVVHVAFDPERRLPVALKLLQSAPGENLERRRVRLVREANALAMISHKNVVRVYEAGELSGQLFLSMELVQGPTLGAWLQARRRPWTDVLAMLIGAGDGLTAAHARGLVHRDFKPANVLIADGRVPKLSDFGLVRAGDERDAKGALAVAVTRTSAVIGTPRYMAPEQHQNVVAGPAADQFAFCAVAFEALYNRTPFRVADDEDLPAEIAYAMEVIAGRAVDPPKATPVPAAIGRAIKRGLAADPNDRHASVADLVAIFKRHLRRSKIVSRTLTMGLGAGLAAGLGGLYITNDQGSSRARIAEACRVTLATPSNAVLDPYYASLVDARSLACERNEFVNLGCIDANAGRVAALDTADLPQVARAVLAAMLPAANDCDSVEYQTWHGWVLASQPARDPPLHSSDDVPRLLEAAALVALAQGDANATERRLRRAATLTSQPQSAATLLAIRAQVLVALKKPGDAAAALTRALAHTQTPQLFVERGWIRLELDLARGDFEKARAAEPAVASLAYLGLGLVAHRSGDSDAANRWLKRAEATCEGADERTRTHVAYARARLEGNDAESRRLKALLSPSDSR